MDGWICIWMYVLLIYASYDCPVVLLGQNALLNLKSFTLKKKGKNKFHTILLMLSIYTFSSALTEESPNFGINKIDLILHSTGKVVVWMSG